VWLKAFILTTEEWNKIMNIRQISLLVVVIIAVIGTLIAVNVLNLPTVFKDKQKFTIDYKVSATGDKLEITTPENVNCSGGPKKGCVKIDKGKKGEITFVFKDPANQWVLNQLRLCPGDTKIAGACSLSTKEQGEFSVMNEPRSAIKLPPSPSGEVDLKLLPPGSKTFYLDDENSFAQTYFYNISVCTVSVGNEPQKCLTLDPPIENKGLK
jgi:hypothetical protein